MPTSKEILDDFFKKGFFEDFEKVIICEMMQKYADQEVKSNSTALINIMLEASETTELDANELTVGEIRDIIREYAKREAQEFKVFGLGNIYPIYSYRGNHVWEIFIPTPVYIKPETITTDQLYTLYQQSKQ